MTDILASFRKRIEDVQKSLGNLNEKTPSVATRADYAFDYKEGRQKYLSESLKRSMSALKMSAWDLVDLRTLDKENEIAVLNLLNLCTKLNEKNPPAEVVKKIAEIEKVSGALKGRQVPVGVLDISMPQMPDEIKAEVDADIDEIKRCFDAACYRSCVVLCGRVLETALHRKYFEATGTDLLETSPGIGLGKLIAKLIEQKVPFDPGLTQQIHLINNVRIHSVHQKQDAFYPSKGQSQAMILYTIDVLKKLF
ncbi:MAG: DUF4145 domain-containing protein [archaeon]